MSSTVYGYCKYVENGTVLEFVPDRRYFNYAVGDDIYRASVRKQFTDSREIVIEKNAPGTNPIPEFKLTNQSLTTWDDHWISAERGVIVDPRILKLNLQRNRLVYVNMGLLGMPRIA